MFPKLRQRWGVGRGRLLLILLTFALGGSLCGRAAGALLAATGIRSTALYIPLYLVVVTLLWPMAVLLVSVPLGQGPFFVRYLRRIWHRMRGAEAS